ncbi:anaerobic ribonucleoside-triphosphate reductase activating protein [Echinicola jeungdonensis]|uniref:Anaerobic ribonucleoside-triphosphate reductase activating protein n=1 Tax=Echinicola jeungdonensis TaxID=709343 RepID=A0ABV5J321_9BACT|nr:anaerobic ribonucleoside-triphosphate reductase activating protein [Echinicola jeungdonensis]MDN3670675.1 anaerobic ribonucleoside-triphosphate reductase activating protein [Echinicola jeungdonensis]
MSKGSILQRNAIRPIYNITPFTLLDFPDKTACIIWFAGCNMRCQYCYNPDIVQGKGKLFLNQALEFIQSRKNLLDGVVLSGGECTLHKEAFILAREAKKMGMLVKVDTNGSLPMRLQLLLDYNLVDYVALDFKSLPKNYHMITGAYEFSNFEKSLHLLIHSKIDFEVRTTVHSDLISQEDLHRMVKFLEKRAYTGNYYLQAFINDVPTIGNMGPSENLGNVEKLSTDKIKVIKRES